jgi:serine O-acetyltransferase
VLPARAVVLASVLASVERTTSGTALAMFGHVKQDYARLAAYRGRHGFAFLLGTLLFDNGFQAVLLYRLSRWLKRARIPVLPACCWRLAIFCTGADVNPNAQLGPGLVISHGVGLVVGGDVVAGRDLLLHHGVTLGAPTPGRIAQTPRFGDGVSIGAGTHVLGAVTVGDGAFLGAGVLVARDVPPRAKVTVAAAPQVTLADAADP